MQKRAGYRRHSIDGRECRHLRRDLSAVRREQRAGEDASGLIRGLAAVFYREADAGTEYWLWHDMVERILPGAFDRAIAESHDARALFNHDPDNLLGRVSSGTCRLSVTAEGLAYEVDEDVLDPDHVRVCSKIDRGDVTGSSFAFVARAVTWEEVKLDDGKWLYIRNITDVDLYDVGPVTYPAYEASTSGRDGGQSRGQSGSPTIGSSLRQQDDQASIPLEIRELIHEREQQLRVGDDELVAIRKRMLELD